MDLKNKTVLITGVAGFIGSYLAKRLYAMEEDIRVVGIDNMNDYYDVELKKDRLRKLESYPSFVFLKGNIADKNTVQKIFQNYLPQIVVNLAAQAGVRYSILNPDAYIESNLVGFFNILEGCRHYPVEHLVYASSSSVYGSNKKIPYSVDDQVDNPVSLYAATKKSNELMAYAYSKLYAIPATGLRFLLSMVLPVVLTWPTLVLQINCWLVKPSKFSITAIVSGISPISMTLSPA